MEELIVDDNLTINNTNYKLQVVLIQDISGRFHYIAKIDDEKPFEVEINEDGLWMDPLKGVTDISIAIGNLIESKTY
jgi:hypothetical protein